MKHRALILVVTVILATALLNSGATQARPAVQGQPLQPPGGAPPLFSYQGLLLDSAGNPVSNGVYTITFSIYDLPISGTLFWSETQAVPVEGGLFNVTLGIFSPIDPAIVNGLPLWLGVTLQGEPEMVPRQNLVSVPYALNAADTRMANIHPLSVFAISPGGTALYGSAPVTGVLGLASASTGWTYGVYGRSDSTDGRGVLGYVGATSGSTFGVYGYASSTAGTGVYGNAVAASGSTYGVYGRSGSTGGSGVYGWASAISGQAYGVYGKSESGYGAGIYGTAPSYGVYGRAESFYGMGVYGLGADTEMSYGVYGESLSSLGAGVYGLSSSTASGGGVVGEVNSDSNSGVEGIAVGSTSDYGLYSWGNTAATGSKSAVVPTRSFGWRSLYSMESPEVLFEDVGTAHLVDGQAVVALDPIFAETVNLEEGYQVFLTAQGPDLVLLVVATKSAAGFTVRGATLDGKPTTCDFDYRIIAKRLGFEGVRLAPTRDPATLLPARARAARGVQP